MAHPSPGQGEYIYALRGEFDEDNPFGDFSRYNISTGQWQILQPLPSLGGVGDGASLLWIGRWEESFFDSIFAFAGGSVDEEPGYEVYRYSISENQWQRDADIPCPVGHYVGNRLGYAEGSIYYWQGSPQSNKWLCGGDAFFAAQLTPAKGDTESVEHEATAAHLLINEVEMNPPDSDSGNEWVELFNPTDVPASLAGWVISYTANVGGDGWDDLPSAIVEPGEYYQFTYPKRHLENSRGESIQLRDAFGEIVDETPLGLTDEADDSRTWQRIPNGSDTDLLADWVFASGTPGIEN